MKFDARWQNFYGHDFVGAAFLPPVIRPPTLSVCGVMRAAKCRPYIGKMAGRPKGTALN